MNSCAKSTAIILPYDHALDSLWNTKGVKPNTEYLMPCFEKQEILSNQADLFYDRDEKWKGGTKMEDMFDTPKVRIREGTQRV